MSSIVMDVSAMLVESTTCRPGKLWSSVLGKDGKDEPLRIRTFLIPGGGRSNMARWFAVGMEPCRGRREHRCGLPVTGCAWSCSRSLEISSQPVMKTRTPPSGSFLWVRQDLGSDVVRPLCPSPRTFKVIVAAGVTLSRAVDGLHPDTMAERRGRIPADALDDCCHKIDIKFGVPLLVCLRRPTCNKLLARST